MIDLTLKLICDRLNAHLSALYSVPDGLVAIGPLNDSEGKPTAEARNKLTIFVTNLAQDSMPRNGTTRSVSQIGQARPVHLDIYFMLASGYDAEIYEEGLKLISSALMFFQSNAVMTPQNTPEMPSGISQLSIDIANLKVEEIGQLWGNLGGRYVPSVMFKVRSVIIDAGLVQSITPLIRAPSSDAKAEAG